MSFSLLIKFFYRQLIHEPPKPTASFKGKVVIVTGGNSGLGLEASRWIVRLGASRVILACRNSSKGEAAVKDIQKTTSCSPDTVQLWPLDMSSYSSVYAFVDRAKAELPRLDALIANAGVAMENYCLTEGVEETMVINVISTTLLGFLLHPKLRETAQQYKNPTHFTAVGSALYQMAKFKEREAPVGQLFESFNVRESFNTQERYSTSKLLLHFALQQMASLSSVEASGVVINWVDPG
jgi:NAD(P)-dependent dehydrogenase (short-subunit alcohol dehydrogenase family)